MLTSDEMPHPERDTSLPWTRVETVAIGVMTLIALFAHFWNLGFPTSFVYDEHIYVDEAYKYMRGEPFFEVHPPFAVILMTLCTYIFGCHPWSWRVPSAVLGTALIPVTYLLARRMFYSRLAATLATLLTLCEGLFLSYSRLALINIVYLSLGAVAYLALYRFLQSDDAADRRRSLVFLGIALGLGLGSKLAIPAIPVIVASGFIIASCLPISMPGLRSDDAKPPRLDSHYAIGAMALVGGVTGFFFFLTFLPNYLAGWWRGVSAVTNYYHRVMIANAVYPSPPSHQDSPWWSWPLMLRPYKEWQKMDDAGMYLALWGGGNPAIWWAALVAIATAAVRAIRRSSLTWAFLIIGYLLYMVMWVPVHRALYLYCYMPALYLGILALAGILDSCWRGTAELWEQLALLLPVFAVSLIGMDYIYGAIICVGCIGAFIAARRFTDWSGKLVSAIVLVTALAVFIYYLPLWMPLPLSENQLEARMWLQQGDLVNWK